jgi:hypothetical protein
MRTESTPSRNPVISLREARGVTLTRSRIEIWIGNHEHNFTRPSRVSKGGAGDAVRRAIPSNTSVHWVRRWPARRAGAAVPVGALELMHSCHTSRSENLRNCCCAPATTCLPRSKKLSTLSYANPLCHNALIALGQSGCGPAEPGTSNALIPCEDVHCDKMAGACLARVRHLINAPQQGQNQSQLFLIAGPLNLMQAISWKTSCLRSS